jgi:hypothetical protein
VGGGKRGLTMCVESAALVTTRYISAGLERRLYPSHAWHVKDHKRKTDGKHLTLARPSVNSDELIAHRNGSAFGRRPPFRERNYLLAKRVN